MQKEAFSRIEFIDLAKGFCILGVLWIHVRFDAEPDRLEYMMRCVRMPLYFFLSGLFFKTYSGLHEFTLRKVNKLLIPFFFFYLLSYFSGVLCHFLGFYEKGIIQDPFEWTIIFDVFLKETYTYNAPIWFLISLFEVSLVSYVMIRYLGNKTLPLLLTSFILGIGSFTLFNLDIDLPWHLDTSMRYIPFFILGYLVRTNSRLLYPNKNDRFIPVAVLLTGVIVYLLAPEKVENEIFFYYISAISGILLVLLLSKRIKKIPVISYAGRFSLIILGTHTFLVGPLRYLFSRFITNTEVMLFAVWVAIIFVSMAIIPVLIRLFPAFLAQKDLIPVNKATKTVIVS